MFTVRHDKPDGSSEFHKVVRVQRIPADERKGYPPCVDCIGSPDVPATAGVFVGRLSGGTVYIMNERGSTIASFDLR